MKPKHLLIFTLGIILTTLIACTKDEDGLLDDSPQSIQTSFRGAEDLNISYRMSTSQNIKPTTGTLEDLCALDVKIISIPKSTTKVTTILGQDGQACITMEDQVRRPETDRNGGKSSNKTITKYCDGVLTYTDEDGEVTTVETVIDITLFKSIYESYYYTESQQDSMMNVMVQDAERNGAKVTKNGNALTIVQIDSDGNKETTVYDIKNRVMVSSTIVDSSGKVISKSTLGYKCDRNGKIVPDFIISYNYKDNMICSDPVYTVEQVKFDRFQITL